MLKPIYKVKIGSETFEPGAQSPLVSIRVSQDIDIPADSFETVFGVSDKTMKIKEGDEVTIQIGYEEDLKDVFKGTVDGVSPGVSYVTVRGLNTATKLLELRVNQVYLNMNAGQIVKDLAKKAGIKLEASDGVKFSVYYLDNSKNAHEHICELAKKCGFDAYMTPEGDLVFKKYTKGTVHVLEYGKNVIQAEVQEDRPTVKSVMVQGESASSFKGADSWPWLTKKEVSGTKEGANNKGAEILVQDASIKETGAAGTMAGALMQNMSRTFSGAVKIVGDAGIKLGETVEIKGMNNSKMNGEFQVRSVEHIISKALGFTTQIGWSK
jgi:prophage tail gpP-like protein